jgi:hypothetical protein
MEGTVKMSGKPSSALSGVEKACLPDECEGQIVDRSHDPAHLTDGHAGCIFTKGNVTAIVQTGFDIQMVSAVWENL